VGGRQRDRYEADVAKVEALQTHFNIGEDMITAALRYVISHPATPVAIPGAKSPAQAAMNAAAGERLFSAEELVEIRSML
jgi:aryl-alcohol dehydrogenase-like predicted oxidoreductase